MNQFNLETITACDNSLTRINGWFVTVSDKNIFLPAPLLPPVHLEDVEKSNSLMAFSSFKSKKFWLYSRESHPSYLMRASIKEAVINIPERFNEQENFVVPSHEKEIVLWDFSGNYEKRYLLFFIESTQKILFSKDLHILVDDIVEDWYSSKYIRSVIASTTSDKSAFLKDNQILLG